MVKIPRDIQILLKKINDEFKPVSIFLYGSKARTDSVKDSDYEIGILYLPDHKISRSDLSKINPIKNLRLYPFNYYEFLINDLDTPFPKVMYMWGLITKSKTLYGKKVVENLKLPKISLIDLLEEAVFQVSRAYTAVLSEREKDLVNARAGFSKSALYSARVLVLLETKKFPIEYDQIVKEFLNLDLNEELKLLIRHAYDVRLGTKMNPQMLFKNISFINKVVIHKIKDKLKTGNRVIL